MKKCVKCGITKDFNEFASRKSKSNSTIEDLRNECRICYNEYMRNYLKNSESFKTAMKGFTQKRIDLIRQIKLSTGCCICNYCKNGKALQFHHLDKDAKNIDISRASTCNADFLAEEISKCVILCANCHFEVEDGQHLQDLREHKLNITSEYFLVQRENTKINKLSGSNKCSNCKKSIARRAKVCVECHSSCKTIPSKEILEELIWQKPTTHIAKDYGVSDKAVEKWCIKYGLSKPPRGYWSKVKMFD